MKDINAIRRAVATMANHLHKLGYLLSQAWLKRIAISWVVLNGLGFILAYVTPFFSDGKWNG